MRLGLLADIHEDVLSLQLALKRLDALGVDRYVVLGDLFDRGDHADLGAVVDMLREVGAVGVWGNHDVGLCFEPDDEVVRGFPARILTYMTTLRARLAIGECHFSHIEPALDPTLLEDLWSFAPRPVTPASLAPNFAALSHRLMFMGHYHTWLAARPDAILPWQGEGALVLAPPARYFLVVHAVRDGWCGHLDTSTHLFTPVSLDTWR